MSRQIFLMSGLALVLLGCNGQPSRIFDTTGAEFGWNTKTGSWWPEVLDETPPPPACNGESEAIYTILVDRFINVTSACTFADGGGWSSGGGAGRYLACEDDRDCPQFDFPDHPELYECSAGLCQNLDVEKYPRDELRRQMAEPLCIADLERPHYPQEIGELLDEHCGPDSRDLCPLPLPEPCWTP